MKATLKEIESKTLLRKMKRIDSWFISAYGMNLYRGCEHGCAYCDGRAEKYQVEGNFDKEIIVKKNALSLLKKELDPARKRTPFKKGYIFLGGGVGDSYQPLEKEYKLTRRILEFLTTTDFPIHILTKSTLVLRDLDLLKEINKKRRVLVSFSLSSANDEISAFFEPCASSPSERLAAIKEFKTNGIHSGVFLLPVLPFITDNIEVMEDSLKKIKESGADYMLFGGMTLKQGRQMDYFYGTLEKYNPELKIEYDAIYNNDQWGSASHEYYSSIYETFNFIKKKYTLPERIPVPLFKDIVDVNDYVSILLDHLDYFAKAQGQKSPYGYASYVISTLKYPIREKYHRLTDIKGVGPATARIIQEILQTGNSRYLQSLMNK